MLGIENVDWERERRRLMRKFRIWFGAEEAEERAQSALCMLWDNARRFDVSLTRARKVAFINAMTGGRRFCADAAHRPSCVLRGKTRGKARGARRFHVSRLGNAAEISCNGAQVANVHHRIDLAVWIGSLTPLQRRVLVLLRVGHTRVEICYFLGISERELDLVLRTLRASVPDALIRP